nr:membrane protein insertion efficiency factor YidD [Microbacterium agarici]
MVDALRTVLLIPRNLAVALLQVYRRLVSPLYGDVCRYYPSCSAFTLRAIQIHGVVIGSVMGVRRILRCHPWAAGGIDDVPEKKNFRYALNRHGFVVSPTDRKN